MLAGAPGTAAATAAACILVAEGGFVALARGAGCYVALFALWFALDVARAWFALRGRLPIVPWRPNLLFRVYPVSKRNLLDRISRRMTSPPERPADGPRPHRAFGAVVGNCPFAHVGGATLANAALRAQPVKAPLYHAFKAFAGEGIFTAEGRDWADKRAEVLAAFAAAGLEPLADASARVARRLTREIDIHLHTTFDSNGDPNVGRGGVVEMLPRLQRATLRATFAYLVGRSVDDAVAAHGAERGTEWGAEWGADQGADQGSVAARWEDEYLAAATALRHLIPARARSVWMASDWLYALSPVGRLEARSIRAARRLPALAIRAALPGSPLAMLARGRAHGGAGRADETETETAPANAASATTSTDTYMGAGVFMRSRGGKSSAAAADDATTEPTPAARHPSRHPREKPSAALMDETVTLLFAGHDTQSATLSWALLRLAADREAQERLRASVVDDPAAAADLGVDDLLPARAREEGEGRDVPVESSSPRRRQPAWRASSASPVLEAALRETLRLHPVAPLVVRKLTTDAVGDDVTLPAGCAAGVWLHAVHRDETAWENPDAFALERWLMTAEEYRREMERRQSASDREGAKGTRRESLDDGDGPRVRFKGSAFMPFAAGPRACVGQHLAWVFMRVVLARLVCAYDVQPAEGEDEDDPLTPSVGFTVTPANAARVRLVPRLMN
jgi:cytochrome P450